ncbi:MAG: ROK family protein [Planctomycetota bacterium]
MGAGLIDGPLAGEDRVVALGLLIEALLERPGGRVAAADSDALAGQLFNDQAKALGIALLSTNYLGDYDRLVIGGGVCDLAPAVRDRYRETAEASYHEHALDGFRNLDRLEFSVCGDEAPVIGALAWATP